MLRLEDSGIRVAQYLTELPPQELLERNLHDAIRLPANGSPGNRKRRPAPTCQPRKIRLVPNPERRTKRPLAFPIPLIVGFSGDAN